MSSSASRGQKAAWHRQIGRTGEVGSDDESATQALYAYGRRRKCWYARVLATHRFNLPESGSTLPWRVSYLNSGYIAESELVTEAGLLLKVLVEVSCHTARRHYWPSVGTSHSPKHHLLLCSLLHRYTSTLPSLNPRLNRGMFALDKQKDESAIPGADS